MMLCPARIRSAATSRLRRAAWGSVRSMKMNSASQITQPRKGTRASSRLAMKTGLPGSVEMTKGGSSSEVWLPAKMTAWAPSRIAAGRPSQPSSSRRMPKARAVARM